MAIRVEGVNDWIDWDGATIFDLADDWTIMFKFRNTSATDSSLRYLLNYGDGWSSNNSLNVWMSRSGDGNGIGWYAEDSAGNGDGDAFTSTSSSFGDTDDHVVIMRKVGNDIEMYVDATLEDTINASFGSWTIGSNDIRLGINDSNSSDHDCSFEDFAKWDRAISDAEISALSKGVRPSFFPKDIAFYHPLLNVNNLKDFYNNNADATLVGDTSTTAPFVAGRFNSMKKFAFPFISSGGGGDEDHIYTDTYSPTTQVLLINKDIIPTDSFAPTTNTLLLNKDLQYPDGIGGTFTQLIDKTLHFTDTVQATFSSLVDKTLFFTDSVGATFDYVLSKAQVFTDSFSPTSHTWDIVKNLIYNDTMQVAHQQLINKTLMFADTIQTASQTLLNKTLQFVDTFAATVHSWIKDDGSEPVVTPDPNTLPLDLSAQNNLGMTGTGSSSVNLGFTADGDEAVI